MSGVNTSSPFAEPVPRPGGANTADSPFVEKVEIPVSEHGFDTAISPFPPPPPPPTGEIVLPPPLGGKGATIEAWSDYALACGLVVEDGAKLADIIDQVGKAGFATKAAEIQDEIDAEEVLTEVDGDAVDPA